MTLRPVWDWVRREKATAFMLAFVIALFTLAALSKPAEEPEDSALSAQKRQATALEMRRVGEGLSERLKENPHAALLLSCGALLVFAAGFLVDTVLVLAHREGALPAFLRNAPPRAGWTLGDVFKAFVVAFFAEGVLSLAGVLLVGVLGHLAPSESVVLMGTTFARNVAVALYVLALVRRRYGAQLASLGLTARHLARNAVFGVFAYAGFLPLYFLLLLAVMGIVKLTGYEPPVQTVVHMVYQERDAKALLAFSLFIAVIGPFFEEVFFRGFVYQAFRSRWGAWRGMAAVSALFALLHAHWVAFLPIFALSLALTALFEKTGSLVPGTVFHMFHNGLALFIMLQVKATA